MSEYSLNFADIDLLLFALLPKVNVEYQWEGGNGGKLDMTSYNSNFSKRLLL